MRTIARDILPALLLSVLATVWCRAIVGANLGLYLCTVLLLTLCTPPLTNRLRRRSRWLTWLSLVVGASAVWFASGSAADVLVSEWGQCVLVLAAYLAALTGVATLLAFVRFPASLAAFVTIVLGLLWLTWPVWLSPWLTEPIASWLVPANPMFAINGVLRHLGTWDHAPIAYARLTVLDQDVAYRLPASIAPAVLLHGALGLLMLLPARANPSTDAAPDEAAPATMPPPC